MFPVWGKLHLIVLYVPEQNKFIVTMYDKIMEEKCFGLVSTTKGNFKRKNGNFWNIPFCFR